MKSLIKKIFSKREKKEVEKSTMTVTQAKAIIAAHKAGLPLPNFEKETEKTYGNFDGNFIKRVKRVLFTSIVFTSVSIIVPKISKFFLSKVLKQGVPVPEYGDDSIMFNDSQINIINILLNVAIFSNKVLLPFSLGMIIGSLVLYGIYKLVKHIRSTENSKEENLREEEHNEKVRIAKEFLKREKERV